MEERIEALERRLEAATIKHLALTTAFVKIVGPLLAICQQTPEDVRHVRDTMSSGMLWTTFPELTPEASDRWTQMASEEFHRIFDWLAEQVENAERQGRP